MPQRTNLARLGPSAPFGQVALGQYRACQGDLPGLHAQESRLLLEDVRRLTRSEKRKARNRPQRSYGKFDIDAPYINTSKYIGAAIVPRTIYDSFAFVTREHLSHRMWIFSVFHLTSWSFTCLLYTSPSPRDGLLSRMPSSA